MSRLAAVEGSGALALGPYVSVDTNEQRVAGPHVISEGVNLHLRNGGQVSQSFNGLGYPIMAYNEVEGSGDPILPDDRRGSHNLWWGVRPNSLRPTGVVSFRVRGTRSPPVPLPSAAIVIRRIKSALSSLAGNNNVANSDWALLG